MKISTSQINRIREETDKVLSFVFTGETHGLSRSKEIVVKREGKTESFSIDGTHSKNLLPDVGVG